MNKGRRFLRVWIYLFVGSSTGCAGCFNWGLGGGDSGCGSFGYSCDGGDCDLYGQSDGSSHHDGGTFAFGNLVIAQNLVNPAGIVSDGIYVYYIVDDTLLAVERDVAYGPAHVVATGVRPVGGLAIDESYIYWASAASSDAGTDDAGTDDAGDDDAGADDAGEDAGDDAGALPVRGIFRVSKNGGPIEFLGDLDPLPGIAIENGDLFLNGRGDDAGVIGELTIDGGAGFQPLGAFSGNAPPLRSIAPSASGVAFIDEPNIDFVDRADGGTSMLTSDAGASAIVSTSIVPFYVSTGGSSSLLESVANDAGEVLPFGVGDVTSSGTYVYIADNSNNRVLRYDTTAFGALPTIVTTSTSPILMLAADSAGVCWIEGPPSQTLYCYLSP